MDEINDRQNKSPSVPTLNSYKLTFNKNKDLSITDGVKVTEAYAHNFGDHTRVTLLYKGLGSFTFI